MKNPNFLILDEPTNDLDVFTLAALEEYLLFYPGCMVIVSHDRYFLDKLVDHIFVLNGEGDVKDILGNYDTYRRWEEQEALRRAGVRKEQQAEVKAEKKSDAAKAKISFKDKFEYDQLEQEIPQLEKEKAELEQQLADAGTDHDALLKVTDKLGKVVQELDAKSMRWLELGEMLG
jgi:ATP-binding cassette subfamily F protein uup